MSYENVGKLVDLWMSDFKFREAMRANPQEAVKAKGVTLTQEEWAVLNNVDWNVSDEELKTRLTKGL